MVRGPKSIYSRPSPRDWVFPTPSLNHCAHEIEWGEMQVNYPCPCILIEITESDIWPKKKTAGFAQNELPKDIACGYATEHEPEAGRAAGRW
jgi:hypothetical protein